MTLPDLRVSIHEGETLESLLHRFQKIVQLSGVLREAKGNRYFIRKSEAARIRKKRTPGGDVGRDNNQVRIIRKKGTDNEDLCRQLAI